MENFLIEIVLPIKTVSELNCSEHWTVKYKRHKQQQFFTRLAMKKYLPIQLPCLIILTRLSPRHLDGDNLVGSFKYIRDEISECLLPEKAKTYINKKGRVQQIKGRADDDERLTWEYNQEKSKTTGIRVQIFSL